MGNYVAALACPSSGTSGKVILWDGSVKEFSFPLTVAELMLEHPKQVVAEFQAAVNQKRPVPLPADQELDVKKVYVMLPVKRGKPTALSSSEGRRVLLSANSVLRSKSFLQSSKFLPLFARICPASDVHEMGHKIPSQKKENSGEIHEEVRCLTEFLPESVEGRPEYLIRQYSGKGWKPSLDTIKKAGLEKR
ncbi:hypothetical protein F3Y22_tig00110333pilonHSYRG00088 [Hibiscus syriacus]|uniref:Uncharacterized protein n=1 Tax=Hibiscus syriacus TaxID=106335 RepID=A0A6A3AWC4_HIBSY|nr:uncharacterized protein LOC120120228 [Hibiscus syriacus]KAE8708696.1 hypothetical protein F3Y22_tig00110333pilonHSYRG00088 [Hibiscus syriacus]